MLMVPTAIVAIAAGALHIAEWLGAAPLWVDEEMIALNIRDRGFAGLPGSLWLGQAAPLGWLFIQRAVLVTLGTSEISLRLVPLLFGLATLGAAVWVGQRWLGRPAAILFVLLCGLGEWISRYCFELKHYSADAFFALLLPALAARAADETDAGRAPARWQNWWLAAALAQWFAFGAALVTPACATLVAIAVARRFGARGVLRFAASGLLWVLSFGAHYLVSVQYANRSQYLRNYWAEYFAPQGAGPSETLEWLVERFSDLAADPGGASLAFTFWGCAILGFAVSRRRTIAAVFASVPIVAFILGLARVVPLSGRISLWVVPSLYLGLTLLVDAGVRHARDAWRTSRRRRVTAAAIAAAAGLIVSANIFVRGAERVDLARPRESNRGLNDRDAIAWLMARHEPGEIVMSTRLGWPAVWWYGGIPIDPRIPGGYMRDGSIMFEVVHVRDQPDCLERMEAALAKYRRIAVHVGFPDMSSGFFERLMEDLSRFGAVVDRADFADSRVAIVDLHPPGTPPAPVATTGSSDTDPPRGCVEIRSARRW
jgi:hypothetical protein